MCIDMYLTDTLPLPYRYLTDTLPLPYRYLTDTLTLPYRYLTDTLPIPYHYLTDTLPIIHNFLQFKRGIRTHQLFERIKPLHHHEEESDTGAQNEENIIYSTVVSAGTCPLTFDKSLKQWVKTNEDEEDIIHPLITMNAVTELLIDYSQQSDDNFNLISKCTDPIENNVSIVFAHAISCKPNANSGIKPFILYASNNFKGYGFRTDGPPNPRYDCIQILQSTGETDALTGLDILETPMVKLLGILCITTELNTPEQKSEILFVISPLKEANKSGGDKFLPYSLLRYQRAPRLRNVVYSIVHTSTLYRPCMVIPCHDRCKYLNAKFTHSTRNQEGTESVRMWGIPYKTIDRKGYEDYSNEMNAADDNIDENARDNVDNEQVLFLNSHAINVINNQIRAHLNGGYEDGEEEEDI
jgi:hypothetical protein